MAQQIFRLTPVQLTAFSLLGGNALHTLLFGGSRSGKTFVIVLAIVCRALLEPNSRHCILRKYFAALNKSIINDTLPKVMQLCFPKIPYELNKSLYFVRFYNGSEIWFGGFDGGDKILGNEYATMYFNEVSEFSYDMLETAYSRNAQKCTRIKNRFFYDENPAGKTHWSYKLFVQGINPIDNTAILNPDNYVSMRLNPYDNADNLSETYLEQLKSLSAKKRARFLDGEWVDDNENALWKRSTMIDPYRVTSAPINLDRIVVAVDPAVTNKEKSDRTGIVVAGCKRVRGEMHYYILAERSLIGSPAEWAATAINAYHEFGADRIVAETNQGGDMVEQTIRNIDRAIAYRGVRASRGKIVRAEPIAELYERGKVHHVGEFPALEDEMCEYCGYENEKSPDRMDALVWALTELSSRGIGSRAILAQ